MSQNSDIEWTEATWNPVTGCTRVSSGCDHCYAVAMSRRLGAMGSSKYKGLVNPGKSHFNGEVRYHTDSLSIPLERKSPTLYFVNSMSDLFHDRVPNDFVRKVFEVMEIAEHHTFQILTKRPLRMMRILNELKLRSGRRLCDDPLINVWLGTSVENQETADDRIPLLQQTPAAVRFLSCEPLLAQVSIKPFLSRTRTSTSSPIHWVIVGGESGPKSRPMKTDWVRTIQTDCAKAGVAFFFKQWGGRSKKKTGRQLDGKEFNEMPYSRPTSNLS